MVQRIKKKEGEDFSESTIERVISALNSEPPITKKVACEMLNITYNTKRLQTIIDNYIEQKDYAKKRRKQLRTQAIQDFEKVEIITDYLGGLSLSEISDNTFRSSVVIKRVLLNHNIPLRDSTNTYKNPAYVEDSSNEYKKGDLVYAARYGSPAYIEKEYKDNGDYKVYQVYITGDHEQYAFQASYDLADLRKVQKLGVKVATLANEEVRRLLYEAWLKSKKMDIKGKK